MELKVKEWLSSLLAKPRYLALNPFNGIESYTFQEYWGKRLIEHESIQWN
jgi:hypothetical protein